MEKLFSKEQQQQQLLMGKEFFLDGQYESAESILRLVIESALQHEDYFNYVHTAIWLNRCLINTAQFEKLQINITQMTPFIDRYCQNEELYMYRMHCIIFNSYYSIGDSIDDFKKLFEDLIATPYQEQQFLAGSNLIYCYLTEQKIDLGIALYKQLEPLFNEMDFQNKMTPYMHRLYGFVLYYSKEDYVMCESLLNQIKYGPRVTIVESFSFTYYACEALLEARLGNIQRAKLQFEALLPTVPNLVHLQFHLKLWVKLLEEFELKDDLIKYQQLIIQLLENQYTSEIKRLRKDSIESHSRQFYESQLYIDQLTGAKNRNFFEDLLTKQQHVINYTVAVLDIDRFKRINDNYGHPVGDEVIKFITSQLLDWTPKHDIQVVRYGGDELIILMPYPIQEMEHLLVQLHQSILTTAFYLRKQEQLISLAVSMGVAYTGKEYTTIQQLFEAADLAIYESKKQRGTLTIRSLEEA